MVDGRWLAKFQYAISKPQTTSKPFNWAVVESCRLEFRFLFIEIYLLFGYCDFKNRNL